MIQRRCSKPSCSTSAIATLTYVYADCTAVLGPLSTAPEPHCYDLCAPHAERLTVPLGWEVLRLEIGTEPPGPDRDDLLDLADAVRLAGGAALDDVEPHAGLGDGQYDTDRGGPAQIPAQVPARGPGHVDLTDSPPTRGDRTPALASRGHLRVLPDPS